MSGGSSSSAWWGAAAGYAAACLVAVWGSMRFGAGGRGVVGTVVAAPADVPGALPLVLLGWVVAFHANGLYEYRRAVSPLGGRHSSEVRGGGDRTETPGSSFLSHITYSRAILLLFWVSAASLAQACGWRCGRAVACGGWLCWRRPGGGLRELARMAAQRSEIDCLLGSASSAVRWTMWRMWRRRSPIMGSRQDCRDCA
jgi:hypothetical protein